MDSRQQAPAVTQSDVARVLKLSQTTVSRALRNLNVVPESQRLTIQAAAKKLGYRANPNATALSYTRIAHRPKPVRAALAWLNFWPNPTDLRHYPDFELYWRGASKQALKFGYHMEEFAVRDFSSPKRLEQILLARGIEGIFIPLMVESPWDWLDFDWSHFCIVRMSRTVSVPRVHMVTVDQVANAALALRMMRERGYERVGMYVPEIGPEPHHRLFVYGFLGAQLSLAPKLRLPLCNCPHRNAQAFFERWLQRERPDAILTDWPIADMLHKAGYRIPEDIGLAATSVLGPDADAGINQNPEEIGRAAALMLITLIHDNDRGIPPIFHHILVEGSWQDGHTLPRIKAHG